VAITKRGKPTIDAIELPGFGRPVAFPRKAAPATTTPAPAPQPAQEKRGFRDEWKD
jgi:hypothetical protein